MAGPLLVVDAPSLLFRAFYALPKKITGADGKPVNALLGTANMLLQAVEDHDPRAVVLCFGPDAADYRVALYDGYHADRPPVPPELGPQFVDAGVFFDAFGWSTEVSQNLEADDLLGALARMEADAGGEALVMTGDRDMFQCAGDRVRVLYVSTGKGAQLVGPDEVRERYGIDPGQVPDFIALRGDPSDGIPGAKGVGEKTAASILRKHGTLEEAIEAAEPDSVLARMRDELLAFKEIATLQDVDLERPADRATDYAGGAKAATDKGMNRLAERLERLAAG
jgi:DNA polymerase-1